VGGDAEAALALNAQLSRRGSTVGACSTYPAPQRARNQPALDLSLIRGFTYFYLIYLSDLNCSHQAHDREDGIAD
jgi:hypothetical protein